MTHKENALAWIISLIIILGWNHIIPAFSSVVYPIGKYTKKYADFDISEIDKSREKNLDKYCWELYQSKNKNREFAGSEYWVSFWDVEAIQTFDNKYSCVVRLNKI